MYYGGYNTLHDVARLWLYGILEIIIRILAMKSAILAFLTLNFAALAETDIGRPASYTPYDRYLGPVRTVLGSVDGDQASMDDVKSLMLKGRGFRYKMENPYTPAMPNETAAKRQGDCKDKALWLCDQLDDPSVRFVIGKTKRGAKISHAWVMWQHEGRWWILDCTLKRTPFPADSVSSDRYVPLYSYSKTGAYRHADTAIGVASVASKSNAPVASR